MGSGTSSKLMIFHLNHCYHYLPPLQSWRGLSPQFLLRVGSGSVTPIQTNDISSEPLLPPRVLLLLLRGDWAHNSYLTLHLEIEFPAREHPHINVSKFGHIGYYYKYLEIHTEKCIFLRWKSNLGASDPFNLTLTQQNDGSKHPNII